MITVLILASLVVPRVTAAADSPARALIQRSIAHHDPGGIWWSSVRHVVLRQPRAEGAEQRTTFELRPDAGDFELRVEEGSLAAHGRLDRDSCTVMPLGDDTEASRRRFEKLDCARMRLYRAYYGYLFNAPMNLLDEAGVVAPEVADTEFMDRAVRAVRVTYAEDQPHWEFYFDPETAALVGCRFTRDPAWKSGEYIVFSGEIESNGVRLPRERSWHVNEDGKWLGSDLIEALDVGPANEMPRFTDPRAEP